MRRLISFAVLLIFLCLPALATTYYCSPSGGGTGNSYGSPCTLTQGLAKLGVGDTLYLEAGTYRPTGTVTFSGANAQNEGQRITIVGYTGNPSDVVIDGQWTYPTIGNTNFLMIIGGEASTGKYVTIKDLTIYRSHDGSLLLEGDYCNVTNVKITDGEETGLLADDDYNILDGVTAVGNGWGYYYGSGHTSNGSAICLGPHSTNGIIRNCVSHDNMGEAISGYGGSETITIEDCLIYDNQSMNLYLDSPQGALIQRNIVYTNAGTHGTSSHLFGYGTSWPTRKAGISIGAETAQPNDLTIINNLVLDTYTNLVTFSDVTGLTNCKFVYNTFVNSCGNAGSGYNMGVYFRDDLDTFTGSIFKNNIVIEESGDRVPISCPTSHSGFVFSYNCWNKDPIDTCEEAHDVEADPKITKGPSSKGTLTANYFKLLGTSPAIGKGIYDASYLTDYFQTVRKIGTSPNGPDIGGYEYISGGGPPPIYYVDSSITDTYVASATPDFTTYNHLTFETTGGSDSVYKTIADINACTFVPDDFIYFRKGQTWREQLTVPSSGSAGLSITFGAYGTGDKPKIYGSDQITGWTVYSGNIWQATTTINPNESIFFVNTDGSIKWGTKQTSAAACDAEYEFFSNGTTMYCYAATDPDARYTSVEAPTRAYCIDATGRSYITIDGLDIRHFTDNGIRIYTDTVYNTVQNCHISHGGESVSGAGQGIIIRGSYHQIIGNTIHDCIIHGIRTSTASGKTTSNLTISENEVYDCYHTLIDLSNGNATGVSSGHKVTRNFLHTTSDYAFPLLSCEGIYVASSAATQEDIEVSCNVIINIFSAAIQTQNNVINTNIYNNTCYGTNPLNTTSWTSGISVGGTGSSGIVVKNNIAMDFYSGTGGGDSCFGFSGSSTISSVDNNCWYQPDVERIRVHIATIDNYHGHDDDFTAYKSYIQGILTGAEAHSLWEDPKFLNAGGSSAANYRLASNSPCINAGVNVGLTEDYEGNLLIGLPDIGAYEYPLGDEDDETVILKVIKNVLKHAMKKTIKK